MHHSELCALWSVTYASFRAVCTVVWCICIFQSGLHCSLGHMHLAVLCTVQCGACALCRVVCIMLQAWFSTSILLFASELPSAPASSPSVQVTSEGIPAMPESSVQALMQLTQEFEELANTCLLVLHLEVSYWTRYVVACLYGNCVHATLFGRPLGEAGDKHSCVLLYAVEH